MRGEVRVSEWLASLARDVRYGFRVLRQSPGFSAVALATIALGVAANVTVFSFVDALFLKPLPVPHADRLVIAYGVDDEGTSSTPFGYTEYAYLRAHSSALDQVAAHYSTAPFYVGIGVGGERGEVQGAVVSSNYFAALGLRPERGRFFSAQEDSVPDRDAVAVVGDDFWRRRLGSDPAAIGKTILVNDKTFQIIGIMPPEFRGVVTGESPNEIWIPTMMVRAGYRWCDGFQPDCHVFGILGRLAPGRTRGQAEAELGTLAGQFEAGNAGPPRRFTLKPLRGADPAGQRSFVDLARLLSAAAAILLVIACANLGGLLLARAAARQGEIALRLSLGAGRWRVTRQLLTESLLIALPGGCLGLLLSLWTSRLLAGFYAVDEEGYRHLYDLGLDWRVLGCALVVSLAAGLLFGLWPAQQCLRHDLGRAAAKAPPRAGRTVLTSAQVALSLVLLIGAVLLARSALQIQAGRNFDPRHVLVLRLRPRLIGYAAPQAQAFQREVQRRLALLPGVESVSLARGQGLVWRAAGEMRTYLPGQRPARLAAAPRARFHEVGPRYFATLRIPLLQGREFDSRDMPPAPGVAIVNETMAHALWPSRSPLDETLMLAEEPAERAVRIVGVAADARLRNGLEPPSPMVFLPYWQNRDEIDARLCIRVAGDPEAALPAVRRAISAVDPRVPISEAMPMLVQVRGVYTAVRLAGTVLLCAAGLAVFLSAIGLYGVLAFVVSRRTREIGIRLAVGARRGQVAAIFLQEGLAIAALGVTLGWIAALATARLLAAWLYGVGAMDPLTFVAAPALLALVAVVASYLPARRASRVDPMAALRSE
jgi:predicted permease